MKVAVITGAGSGTGQGVAIALANRGWCVALIGHGRAGLEQTADRIDATDRVHIEVLDVADAAAVEQATGAILDKFHHIDAWINSAAATVYGPLARIEVEDMARAMDVSWNGVVNCSMQAIAHMHERQRGVLINIGSSLAFTSVPNNVTYAATKAAVRSFTLGLSLENKDEDIYVTAAHLPAIASPWFGKVKTLTEFQSRPVGPTHSPVAIGHALADLVENPRNGDMYLGISTVFVVAGARLAPRFTGWVAAKLGVRLQSTKIKASTVSNLYHSVEPIVGIPADLDQNQRKVHWYPPLRRSRSGD